ncbi:carbohydrate ABC transporter permease [Nocardioidaceae bacterium SCSIO 66511]|nr:carbohydrate ABC transporter permease [Nocardioidaceae bacterium SCSIO 66511]
MSGRVERTPAGGRSWIADALLAVAILVAVVPVLWLVFLALQPQRVIISRGWNFEFSLTNFEALLEPGQPYAAQLLNSMVIVIGTVLICLVVGAVSGYALSQLPVPRSVVRILLALAGFIAVVPPMTLVPGLYVTLDQFGLLGSLGGLVLLNAVFQLPFAVLLMRVYFDAVPADIAEAARMDGAGDVRTLWSVMLPIVRPGLATVAVFTAIMAWNDFLFGLTMTSGGTTAPLTVGISSLVQPYETAWGEMAGIGAVAAVPLIVLIVVANRHIVSGLTGGAVKG